MTRWPRSTVPSRYVDRVAPTTGTPSRSHCSETFASSGLGAPYVAVSSSPGRGTPVTEAGSDRPTVAGAMTSERGALTDRAS